MRYFKIVCVVLLVMQIGLVSTATAQTIMEKPRTVITTDGEVDDVDSFIRMLLYANEFDVVGLVYSSSQWHYAGDGEGTLFTSEKANTAELYGEREHLRWPGTTWMQDYIDLYGKVYNNLIKHATGFPSPEHLKSLVKIGNIEFEGEMGNVTEGSELIKELLLDNDPSPVYLQIWGGTNTVARALKSIDEKYRGTEEWEKTYKKVSNKAIIYTVLDQDATYQKYIAPNWPEVKVLYNSDQFWSFAYLWPKVVPTEVKPFLKGKWFAENIKFDHGALLKEYYLWGDGRQIPGDPEHKHGNLEEAKKNNREKYDFISEGDSPAFFYLIDVGLRSMEDASYGGWGGRMVQSKQNSNRWEDGEHVMDFNFYTLEDDTTFPQTRWIKALQNDFAARADWCVMPFEDANHPPLVELDQPGDIFVKPGEKVNLAGSAKDPDGDSLSFKWWQYQEADTMTEKACIKNEYEQEAILTIPKDAKNGDTVHIILEVTDFGTPRLTRYKRVIATVQE